MEHAAALQPGKRVLMDKLIINAALTGMVPTKAQNPALPVTPAEIIADARRCRDAGASIVHIHARERDETPSYRKDIYAEIISGIRQACPELLICGSTSGRTFTEFAQRTEVLNPAANCRPDLASLTLGSLNFPTQASVNEPQMIQSLAEAMRCGGIMPELEVFDLGMADYAKYLVDKQFLSPPFYANILLGSLGTLSATPHNLVAVVRALPEGTIWSATGIGRFQFQVNCLAIAMGGHVRVGLEDSLFYDAAKTRPATNPGLVERLVNVAHSMERDIATAAEARRILSIPSGTARASALPC